MYWIWFRIREWFHWIFRGQNFTRIENYIEQILAPLFEHEPEDVDKICKRLTIALSYLPEDRAQKFYDTIARAGHSLPKNV